MKLFVADDFWGSCGVSALVRAALLLSAAPEDDEEELRAFLSFFFIPTGAQSVLMTASRGSSFLPKSRTKKKKEDDLHISLSLVLHLV